MKSVDLPSITYNDLISSCIGSIDSEELRNRLETALAHLLRAELRMTWLQLMQISFRRLASQAMMMMSWSSLLQKELKNLYTAQMVPANKPSRIYYDDIKLLAPLGICPFCGFGHVKTLDHYLPKSKFPLLSIFPSNLVPCCTDCNKGKLANVAVAQGEQCLHPYFSDPIFINEQWIFATVVHSSPAVVTFHVQRPPLWSDINFGRVIYHFREYDLANRFSVQAGSELASLRKELLIDFRTGGVNEVQRTLIKKEAASS
jgi:hypothetical protein